MNYTATKLRSLAQPQANAAAVDSHTVRNARTSTHIGIAYVLLQHATHTPAGFMLDEFENDAYVSARESLLALHHTAEVRYRLSFTESPAEAAEADAEVALLSTALARYTAWLGGGVQS